MFEVDSGRPIALFDNSDSYLGIGEEDEEGEEYFMTEDGEKLVPVPNLSERFVEYIAGPSGSGKSTVATQLAHIFNEEFPKVPIYVFSRTDPAEDPAFQGLDDAIYIELNEKLIEQPIDITKQGFTNGCLMIFDDVATVHNDLVKKEITKLLTDAMEVGRKLNCNMIITNHLVVPNEKKLARTVLNELNMLTVFPRSGSSQQIRYALKTYFGLNNHQIDDILALKTRWVRISKSFPMYVLHEDGAYIL